jgi:hypothetical protein
MNDPLIPIFVAVTGAEPTEVQKQQAYRVRDAAGVRPTDHDFLAVVYLLVLYGEYPQLLNQSLQALQEFRAQFDGLPNLTRKQISATKDAAAKLAELTATLQPVAQASADIPAVKSQLMDLAKKLERKLTWMEPRKLNTFRYRDYEITMDRESMVASIGLLAMALGITTLFVMVMFAVMTAVNTFRLDGIRAAAQAEGFKAGYTSGYDKAKDEKAAASWANTAEGKAARGLARAGSIKVLSTCNAPGWEVGVGPDGARWCYPRQSSLREEPTGWKLPQQE